MGNFGKMFWESCANSNLSAHVNGKGAEEGQGGTAQPPQSWHATGPPGGCTHERERRIWRWGCRLGAAVLKSYHLRQRTDTKSFKRRSNKLIHLSFKLALLLFVVHWHYVIATEGLKLSQWELNLQNWKYTYTKKIYVLEKINCGKDTPTSGWIIFTIWC